MTALRQLTYKITPVGQDELHGLCCTEPGDDGYDRMCWYYGYPYTPARGWHWECGLFQQQLTEVDDTGRHRRIAACVACDGRPKEERR